MPGEIFSSTNGKGSRFHRHLVAAVTAAVASVPSFNPDYTALFMSIQHPGDGGRLEEQISNWPDGGPIGRGALLRQATGVNGYTSPGSPGSALTVSTTDETPPSGGGRVMIIGGAKVASGASTQRYPVVAPLASSRGRNSE